jgi:hypothetical protein
MSAKLLPTSVRLAPDLLRSVRAAAEQQGCAVSFKIAQILREWEGREKRRRRVRVTSGIVARDGEEA